MQRFASGAFGIADVAIVLREGMRAVRDDARVAGLAEMFDRATQNAGGFSETLTELESVGADVFQRLEGALEKFIRTGKAEWRDLAVVAIEAIGAIVEAQIEALDAAASASGGGFLDGIFGFLGGIFGGGGGSNFLDIAATRTSKPGWIVNHFHYNIDVCGAEPGVEQRVPCTRFDTPRKSYLRLAA